MTSTKMTPREPTPEMVEAGMGAAMASRWYGSMSKNIYRAMWDAAPVVEIDPCFTKREPGEPDLYVTHRCLGDRQNDGFNDGPFQIPCDAVRLNDGTLTRCCGEPCSFVMVKGGSASPDWPKRKDGARVTPCAKDMLA